MAVPFEMQSHTSKRIFQLCITRRDFANLSSIGKTGAEGPSRLSLTTNTATYKLHKKNRWQNAGPHVDAVSSAL
jgi:hypothetical protein